MRLYVFDVDGVLTNPVVKTANQDLLRVIANFQENSLIAFNTGRSFEWLHDRILSPLEHLSKTESLSKHVFASCEMGNVTCFFNGSSWEKNVDPATLIPKSLINEIKDLVNSKYSGSMFFDDKETMISVEIKDGFDQKRYLIEQKAILSEIMKMIQNDRYKNLGLKTASNQIALDVVIENSGKKLGAKKIIEWIKDNSYELSKVLTFGDNLSDIEMAEEFSSEFNTRFVYVGKESNLVDKGYPFKVLRTSELYDKGVVEFLKSYLNTP